MAVRELLSVDDACAWLASRGVVHGAVRLTTDSRHVLAGDAFIAWPGHTQDGRRFVGNALEAGAAACLVEAEGIEAFAFDDESIASLRGLKAATGPIAAAFAGDPSAALDVVAVTGTNGKTSSAWWTAQALTALGRRCGFIGTLGVGEPPLRGQPMSIQATGLTTPSPVTVQATFRRFVDAGFVACGIEASSIGIVEQRLAGTHIAVALFTNFTRDHLDYHGTMTGYWQAKEQLFAWPGLRAAVINVDDAQGAALAHYLKGGEIDVWTYSTRRHARLRARHVGYVDGSLAFELHEGDACVPVVTGLIGDYNVSNALGVIGGLRALGVTLQDAAHVCQELTPVPGRMQRVESPADGPQVVVDYAHTPDALEKALLALKPLARSRGAALWCVFGCGGNRDATKRPLMGALAQQHAQHAVVTSDNPRDEDPHLILAQIVGGMTGSTSLDRTPIVIEDRHAAIVHAVTHAAARDVVLVAGKGHEDYQEVRGSKRPFSDVAEAQAALASRDLAAREGALA